MEKVTLVIVIESKLVQYVTTNVLLNIDSELHNLQYFYFYVSKKKSICIFICTSICTFGKYKN